jgi:hypothetical protein
VAAAPCARSASVLAVLARDGRCEDGTNPPKVVVVSGLGAVTHDEKEEVVVEVDLLHR